MLDRHYRQFRRSLKAEVRKMCQLNGPTQTGLRNIGLDWGYLWASRNRIAEIFGALMVLLVFTFCLLSPFTLAKLFSGLMPSEIALGLWLLTVGSFIFMGLALAEPLPKSRGMLVLHYPLADHVLSDFVAKRSLLVLVGHCCFAISVVYVVAQRNDWSWQLGLIWGILQGFMFTSIQWIGLRFSLPNYYHGSLINSGLAIGGLFLGLALMASATQYQYPFLLTWFGWLPLFICGQAWILIETGNFWGWLYLPIVLGVIGFGFVCRRQIATMPTSTVMQSQQIEAEAKENQMRQIQWWLGNRLASQGDVDESVIGHYIESYSVGTVCSLSFPLAQEPSRSFDPHKIFWQTGWLTPFARLDRLGISIADQRYIPVDFRSGLGAAVWIGVMTGILAMFQLESTSNLDRTYHLLIFALAIGLMERTLFFRSVDIWYFPVGYYRASLVLFKQLLIRLCCMGMLWGLIGWIIGCWSNFSFIQMVSAILMGISLSVSAIPMIPLTIFDRPRESLIRMAVLILVTSVAVLTPFTYWILAEAWLYQFHWTQLTVPIVFLGISLALWHSFGQLHYRIPVPQRLLDQKVLKILLDK